MALDVSEAIALAKDLLKTSCDFQSHDPEMAADFSSRAFEICDDLGIDRSLVGEPPLARPSADHRERPTEQVDSRADEDGVSPTNDLSATELSTDDLTQTELTPAEIAKEEARQTNDQLHSLLQQQARVLQHVRDAEATPEPKVKKRGFWPFRRSSTDYGDIGAMQSA